MALFLSPHYSDLATLGASSQAAGFGVANAQNYRPQKVWRTSGISGEWITFDLLAGVACTACAFSGVNWSSSAVWTIGASNSSATAARTSPSFTAVSGASVWIGGKPTAPRWPIYSAFAVWTNTTAYRYWAVTFTDSGGSGSLDIGRAMIGAAWQPARQFDVNGVGMGWAGADSVSRSAWNQSIIERRGFTARRWDLSWTTITRAEARTGAMQLARQRGNGGDFFLSLDPTDTTNFAEESAQCKFEQMPRLAGAAVGTDGTLGWSFGCSAEEVL